MHDPNKRRLSPRTQISATAAVGAICADVEVESTVKGVPPRPIDRVHPQLTGRGEGATTGGGGAAMTARRRWGRRMRAAGGERTLPRVGAIYADVEVGSAGKGAPPRPIDRIRP